MEFLTLFIAAIVWSLFAGLVVALDRYRRSRDDDRYKEVAQEVAMGLRQAFSALNNPSLSGDFAGRTRAAHAIMYRLVLKARAITGPAYEAAPKAEEEIRPPVDEDPWQ